jgi:AcrR family transcriptional regulator
VRQGLIDAGIELARTGGPEAVILREATRHVGVAPNAAYRHFADRDALLNAVCVAAMRDLAGRMEERIARVPNRYGTKIGATARLNAIGEAYLEFALREPGLFETAFSVPRHMQYATDAAAAGEGGRTAFELLGAALDELADAGLLPRARRPNAEFPVWSAVHGMAMLVNQGPLRGLPAPTIGELSALLRAFVLRGL